MQNINAFHNYPFDVMLSNSYTIDYSFWCWKQNILFNSLAPGKFELNFRYVIFKQILLIDGWGISCETALIWMSPDFTDDQSMLVQVMAWCHQATSHYLSQCWTRSLSQYGVTRPEWVRVPINFCLHWPWVSLSILILKPIFLTNWLMFTLVSQSNISVQFV